MRLNKFLAAGTSLSRRGADAAIAAGRHVAMAVENTTIVLHKPIGYVVSRNGQGSKTVYDLLPTEYQQLNPVGRLDKDSSGLLLLTATDCC